MNKVVVVLVGILSVIAAGTILMFSSGVAGAQSGPHDAVGHLDVAGQAQIQGAIATPDGQTHVSGWAGDPDLGTTSGITVLVYVDNQQPVSTYTHLSRPDVAAVYPRFGPTTGFDLKLALPVGPHVICAWAVNRGPGSSALLGCNRTTLQYHNALAGHIDSITVTPGSPRTITVAGWVLDPLDSGAQLQSATIEQGYVTGQVATPLTGPQFTVTTGLSRPDVAAYYTHGGASGFSVTGPEHTLTFASGQPTCLAVIVENDRFSGSGVQEVATAIAPSCVPFP